jgi:lipoate---protein ligase
LTDRALRSGLFDPWGNLSLEEALLERGPGGGSALLLYADDPCVVVGRNQNPWAEVSARASLPVLRRVSGGGAVYHDRGNLNWAFIVPRSRHDRDGELALVAAALRELGIEAEPGPRGGLFAAGEGPFRGSKVSGTARRLAAERVLHHGTLLVDSDLPRLRSCLGGLPIAETKALPSVASPCVNLSSISPGLSLEDAAEALSRTIAGRGAEDAEGAAEASFRDGALRRLRSWDWTWGATPPFSLNLEWSGGTLRVEVRAGRVAAASGPGSSAILGLIGSEFGYGTPMACVEALEGGRRPPPFGPAS